MLKRSECQLTDNNSVSKGLLVASAVGEEVEVRINESSRCSLISISAERHTLLVLFM